MSAIATLATMAALAGPLGTKVDLGSQAGYLGVDRETVRQVLLADGVRVLVALDRRDRSLCVGYRHQPEPGFFDADFRCFGPGAEAPVIAFVRRAGADVDRVDRVTVFGVARRPLRRLELGFPDGRTQSVALRALRAVRLRAFAASAEGTPLPTALRAGPHELPLVALAEPPCIEACVGVAGPWADVVGAGG